MRVILAIFCGLLISGQSALAEGLPLGCFEGKVTSKYFGISTEKYCVHRNSSGYGIKHCGGYSFKLSQQILLRPTRIFWQGSAGACVGNCYPTPGQYSWGKISSIRVNSARQGIAIRHNVHDWAYDGDPGDYVDESVGTLHRAANQKQCR